jgi:hypothetical protein
VGPPSRLRISGEYRGSVAGTGAVTGIEQRNEGARTTFRAAVGAVARLQAVAVGDVARLQAVAVALAVGGWGRPPSA